MHQILEIFRHSHFSQGYANCQNNNPHEHSRLLLFVKYLSPSPPVPQAYNTVADAFQPPDAFSQQQPATSITPSPAATPLQTILTLACWGMPPSYLRRFHAAYDAHRKTLQPAPWESFLDQVRKERAAANVVVRSCLYFASYIATFNL